MVCIFLLGQTNYVKWVLMIVSIEYIGHNRLQFEVLVLFTTYVNNIFIILCDSQINLIALMTILVLSNVPHILTLSNNIKSIRQLPREK